MKGVSEMNLDFPSTYFLFSENLFGFKNPLPIGLRIVYDSQKIYTPMDVF